MKPLKMTTLVRSNLISSIFRNGLFRSLPLIVLWALSLLHWAACLFSIWYGESRLLTDNEKQPQWGLFTLSMGLAPYAQGFLARTLPILSICKIER
ncbi:hypothetical protein [Enterovibrio norvegicus]|uniref:hypothetical protein n=1 Tax=Enterovibrio norvegicus TaxID=188144 RepID=UPI00354CFBF2